VNTDRQCSYKQFPIVGFKIDDSNPYKNNSHLKETRDKEPRVWTVKRFFE
jgi:hypothetical protein